jgi:hypothetical protein
VDSLSFEDAFGRDKLGSLGVVESKERTFCGDQERTAGCQRGHWYTSAFMLDESAMLHVWLPRDSREVWVTLASNAVRWKATAGGGIFGVQSAPHLHLLEKWRGAQ